MSTQGSAYSRADQLCAAYRIDASKGDENAEKSETEELHGQAFHYREEVEHDNKDNALCDGYMRQLCQDKESDSAQSNTAECGRRS